ncbi:MAG: hypothetical protein C4525_00495 [Desulfarculus sp.]|nr:MAG: hypothetical protein C4525_00495 [Desulfarculus sp.]
MMVETAGEMPEVALAESLHHLGHGVTGPELDCLRAAAVRAYLKIIERDLDPANLGLSLFRGLERAADNLERLAGFLRRLGWPPPAERWQSLVPRLERYLAAEQAALEAGRPYASASPGQVRDVAAALGLDLAPWAGLLQRLAQAPALDFMALRAMARLQAAGGAAKRRQEAAGWLAIEVLDAQGRPRARTELGLLGADEREDPASRARAEQVWDLLDLPAT